MKAKLISQRVSANLNDFVHGGGRFIRRLIIEELDGLCINVVDKQVYSFTGFNLDNEDFTFLETVEVSQDVIDMAVAIAQLDFELKLARAKLFIELKTDTVLKKNLLFE